MRKFPEIWYERHEKDIAYLKDKENTTLKEVKDLLFPKPKECPNYFGILLDWEKKQEKIDSLIMPYVGKEDCSSEELNEMELLTEDVFQILGIKYD